MIWSLFGLACILIWPQVHRNTWRVPFCSCLIYEKKPEQKQLNLLIPQSVSWHDRGSRNIQMLLSHSQHASVYLEGFREAARTVSLTPYAEWVSHWINAFTVSTGAMIHRSSVMVFGCYYFIRYLPFFTSNWPPSPLLLLSFPHFPLFKPYVISMPYFSPPSPLAQHAVS